MSGKKADRPALNKLKIVAKKGDNVYIESISRLGRNVEDLGQLCEYFTDKGVYCSLCERRIDHSRK